MHVQFTWRSVPTLHKAELSTILCGGRVGPRVSVCHASDPESITIHSCAPVSFMSSNNEKKDSRCLIVSRYDTIPQLCTIDIYLCMYLHPNFTLPPALGDTKHLVCLPT